MGLSLSSCAATIVKLVTLSRVHWMASKCAYFPMDRYDAVKSLITLLNLQPQPLSLLYHVNEKKKRNLIMPLSLLDR